jgi:tetratricopeptide (TPR) repeat protein
MKHSEVSAYFAKKAFNYIRANPARTLKLLAIKTVLFWGPEIVANNKEIHFFKQHSQILCHIPGFAMVLSLAMVGVIHLFLIYKRRGEQSDKSPQVTQEQFEMAIIMLLFVFSYFISLLPFFVAERFRVPVIPFLLLFGAYGLYRMGILIASHDLKRVIFWAIVYLVLYIETAQPRTSYTPNPIRWRYTRGNVYLLAKKSDFAIREYREAIRLGLDLPEVGASNKEFIYNTHRRLAQTFSKLNQFEEAIEHYNKALTIDSNLPQLHCNLGVALLKMGKFDAAVTSLKQALHLEPDLEEAHSNLKVAQQKKKELERIVSTSMESLKQNPNQPDMHSTLGLIFHQQGDVEKAVYHWNTALQLRPDWVEVLNNLAWAKAAYKNEDFHDPEEAIQLSLRASELTGHKEPGILDTLSVAYAAAGRFPEAVESAEKAISLAKSSNQQELVDEIQSHLGLYKQGQAYYDNSAQLQEDPDSSLNIFEKM